MPVDTGDQGRGCAVTGIHQLPLDQAWFSELHCLLLTTFSQGRQASCAWASGSRQRSTLSSPKTHVLEQIYRSCDFGCPQISLAVTCRDQQVFCVGCRMSQQSPKVLAWSSRDNCKSIKGKFQTLQTLWHEHPDAWVLELTTNKWMKSFLRNLLQ